MPTYEYQCTACGHELEEFHSILEPPLTRCPKCDTDNLVRMMGTGGGLIFKGSGFYQTDYKKEGRSPGKDGAPGKGEAAGADGKRDDARTDRKGEAAGADGKREGARTERKDEAAGADRKGEGARTERKDEAAGADRKGEGARTERKDEAAGTDRKGEGARTGRKDEAAGADGKRDDARTDRKSEGTGGDTKGGKKGPDTSTGPSPQS